MNNKLLLSTGILLLVFPLAQGLIYSNFSTNINIAFLNTEEYPEYTFFVVGFWSDEPQYNVTPIISYRTLNSSFITSAGLTFELYAVKEGFSDSEILINSPMVGDVIAGGPVYVDLTPFFDKYHLFKSKKLFSEYQIAILRKNLGIDYFDPIYLTYNISGIYNNEITITLIRYAKNSSVEHRYNGSEDYQKGVIGNNTDGNNDSKQIIDNASFMINRDNNVGSKRIKSNWYLVLSSLMIILLILVIFQKKKQKK